MLTPDQQKIYFTNDDLSKVYPDAEDAEEQALAVLEGEQSFIMVDGHQMAIGYDEDNNVIIVEDSDASDDEVKKARKLLSLFVENELFKANEIERENGFMPDEDYPCSVNVTDGQSMRVVAYYPSLEMLANAKVQIWSGSGYTLDEFYVNVDKGAENAEEALAYAVVQAEKAAPEVLQDVSEVEELMAKEGHYDKETGEGDEIFQEMYTYVDATMEGASEPYYIFTENLGILPHKGVLA